MALDFPLEGMELTHILVSADTARARDFYVGTLGAELYREYGSSIVLRFLGNWFLLVEGGGPTKGQAHHYVRPAFGPGLGEPFVHHPGPRLSGGVRDLGVARGPIPHSPGRLGRGDPSLLPGPGRAPVRAERSAPETLKPPEPEGPNGSNPSTL
jgi:catechol 2,3-dioxygenase-like lactoylglutathione lyase family enzyme